MSRLATVFALASLASCRRAEHKPPPGDSSSALGDRARPESPASAAREAPSSSNRLLGAPSSAPSSSPRETTPLARETPAPLTDSGTALVHFAIVGDYGGATPAEARVAAMIKSWDPDFILTTGDNNYPAGEASTIDANVGQYYSDFIGNYRGKFGKGATKNRFWPALGNHDWIEGPAPYLAYFTLPGNERYYDVDFGPVHVYAIDSDSREPDGIDAGSRQAAWLESRLAVSRACWDIVYFHHPAYSTALHGSLVAMRWPFEKWGAEAVVAGHDHTYERFAIAGIPYFVDGLGGESLYSFLGDPLPETRYRFNEEYGAMRVTATAQQITYEFITVDGKTRDTLVAPCAH